MLPGQYVDAKAGKHYNYFRDYDPAVGRYIESDPIGLRAGLNTYAYVDGTPLSFADPMGLMGFGGGTPGNRPGHSRFQPQPGSPFPGYNWCGPGDRGGAPTNCVDATCKKHDECYDRCGLRAATRFFPNSYSRCAAKCDLEWSKDHKRCLDEEFCKRTLEPLAPLPLGA